MRVFDGSADMEDVRLSSICEPDDDGERDSLTFAVAVVVFLCVAESLGTSVIEIDVVHHSVALCVLDATELIDVVSERELVAV